LEVLIGVTGVIIPIIGILIAVRIQQLSKPTLPTATPSSTSPASGPTPSQPQSDNSKPMPIASAPSEAASSCAYVDNIPVTI
jgi:hypothetical protein